MNTTDKRTNIILESLRDNSNVDFNFADCYGEPGYRDPQTGIIYITCTLIHKAFS